MPQINEYSWTFTSFYFIFLFYMFFFKFFYIFDKSFFLNSIFKYQNLEFLI